jgi:hypothetical protein
MMAIMAAMAVKQGMDQRRNAAIQRKNAIAQQKVDREALLKQRAEQGDAASLEAFQKSRQARADEARIKVASGEQGVSTGSIQTQTLLQGLGFGTGLQVAADERSANNALERNDLSFRASSVRFTNKLRTIEAKTPSTFGVALSGAAAGAQGFTAAGGKLS